MYISFQRVHAVRVRQVCVSARVLEFEQALRLHGISVFVLLFLIFIFDFLLHENDTKSRTSDQKI